MSEKLIDTVASQAEADHLVEAMVRMFIPEFQAKAREALVVRKNTVWGWDIIRTKPVQ